MTKGFTIAVMMAAGAMISAAQAPQGPPAGGRQGGPPPGRGNVVFTGGPSSDLVALNATTGAALWQARLNAAVANGPITDELDGLQYVLVGAGDTLWTFVMNERK